MSVLRLSKSYLLNSRNILRNPASSFSSKLNTGILFVPEKEAWVIERFGKFSRVLEPGFNLSIPIVEEIAYVQLLKEIAIDIPDQSAITADNVVLHLNGVLFLKVEDPILASYGVEDAEFAITQLAQTTMRSEIGKIILDDVFKEREVLNLSIVHAISKAAEPWGIKCLRYEIRDIKLPDKILTAMQMQVEAERKKRAVILESEGERDSQINIAQGAKQSSILSSEGLKIEKLNIAEAESQALLKVANAKAEALKAIAKSLENNQGHSAVQMAIAEKYITAFQELAKKNNTVLLPSNVGDISSAVAQAMAIYKNMGISQDLDLESKLTDQKDLKTSIKDQ